MVQWLSALLEFGGAAGPLSPAEASAIQAIIERVPPGHAASLRASLQGVRRVERVAAGRSSFVRYSAGGRTAPLGGDPPANLRYGRITFRGPDPATEITADVWGHEGRIVEIIFSHPQDGFPEETEVAGAVLFWVDDRGACLVVEKKGCANASAAGEDARELLLQSMCPGLSPLSRGNLARRRHTLEDAGWRLYAAEELRPVVLDDGNYIIIAERADMSKVLALRQSDNSEVYYLVDVVDDIITALPGFLRYGTAES